MAAEVFVPAAVDGPVPHQRDPGRYVQREDDQGQERPGRPVEVSQADDDETGHGERM
ncbi:hypothetical protein GCM10022254_66100 [Actinomadura meridiana]|uniref:Uncharacterized protein n=1 Tax=Actinomadura meridiana TaxID=559626 RepID=A0ABP8CL36_9ACTN